MGSWVSRPSCRCCRHSVCGRSRSRHRGDGDDGRQASAHRRGAGACRRIVGRQPAPRHQRHRLFARRDDPRRAGEAGQATAWQVRRIPLHRRRHAAGRSVNGPGRGCRDRVGGRGRSHARRRRVHRRGGPRRRHPQGHGTDRRLAEAARLGFKSAMVPPGVKDAPAGLRIRTIEDIGTLLHGVQRIADNGG